MARVLGDIGGEGNALDSIEFLSEATEPILPLLAGRVGSIADILRYQCGNRRASADATSDVDVGVRDQEMIL